MFFSFHLTTSSQKIILSIKSNFEPLYSSIYLFLQFSKIYSHLYFITFSLPDNKTIVTHCRKFRQYIKFSILKRSIQVYSSPKSIPERNSSICIPGHMQKNVHSGTVHNSENLETTHMFFSGRKDEKMGQKHNEIFQDSSQN